MENRKGFPLMFSVFLLASRGYEDAAKRESYAGHLGQVQPFSQKKVGKKQGEDGDEVAEQRHHASLNVLEGKIEAHVNKDAYAYAHVQQTSQGRKRDILRHRLSEQKGQEDKSSADSLYGRYAQRGVASRNEAHAYGIACRSEHCAEHEEIAQQRMRGVVRTFGEVRGRGHAQYSERDGDDHAPVQMLLEEKPCRHGRADGEAGGDDASLRSRGELEGIGLEKEEQHRLEKHHGEQVLPVAFLVGQTPPEGKDQNIEERRKADAGKDDVDDGKGLEGILHGYHTAPPHGVAEDEKQHDDLGRNDHGRPPEKHITMHIWPFSFFLTHMRHFSQRNDFPKQLLLVTPDQGCTALP